MSLIMDTLDKMIRDKQKRPFQRTAAPHAGTPTKPHPLEQLLSLEALGGVSAPLRREKPFEVKKPLAESVPYAFAPRKSEWPLWRWATAFAGASLMVLLAFFVVSGALRFDFSSLQKRLAGWHAGSVTSSGEPQGTVAMDAGLERMPAEETLEMPFYPQGILQGIVADRNLSYCLIGGKVYKIGDRWQGHRILAIDPKQVELQSPAGQIWTLVME